MIVLLNVLTIVVILSGVLFSYKLKKWWPAIIASLIVFAYTFIQPSYMPKGEIKRTPISFENKSHAQINNRLKSAQEGSKYDQDREDKIREGLPFINKGD